MLPDFTHYSFYSTLLFALNQYILDKVRGAVNKDLAKKLINEDIGGSGKYYFGSITGKVIPSSAYGSQYYFLINKITLTQ